jgi:hypothetical protein
MRPIERIKPYISLLKNKTLTLDISEKETVSLSQLNSEPDYDKLEKFWLENPDLRFTQVCVNTGLIPNIPGFWYYTEDLDFMLNLGFEPREVMLWGTYGKNLDQPLKYIFLKEMSNSHIQAVLDNVKSISERYRKEFENELKYRKENNIKIEDL